MANTGYKQTLLWGAETTYGAVGTIDEPIGLVQSVNPTENNDTIKIRTMGGTRDYSNIVPGKFSISGSFDYYLQVGPMLRMAFGEDSGTTAGVDAGPKFHTGGAYRHVMGSATAVGADAFPSFSLEFTDYENSTIDATTINLKRTYTGCRVNNLAISASVDEPVKCTVDWVAQGVTVSTGAPTSVSQSTKDPFVFYQGAVYATSATITAYTALSNTESEIAEVNSLNFAINNNLESVWYVSGTTATTQTLRGIKALLAKGRDYTASLGLHFKNKKMYQRFLGSSTSTVGGAGLNKYTIVVDFSRSGYPGSTPKAATDDYMRLVLASCAFNSNNITGSPEDIVSQDIDVMVPKAKLYFIDTDALYT